MVSKPVATCRKPSGVANELIAVGRQQDQGGRRLFNRESERKFTRVFP
jgi:hypothetical protein